MNRLKSLLYSPAFLVAASLLGIGLATGLIFPISAYISERSLSVVNNFYLVGGFMLLLAGSSLAQSTLVARLVWGGADKENPEPSAEDHDLSVSMRAMKVTGAKRSFVFGAVLIINIFGFNALGKGILVTGNAKYNVLTKLRSGDPQTRADAVPGAIRLIGDEDVTEALRKVLEKPGGAREWSAYAAGIRRDTMLMPPLRDLLLRGNPRERAAAAVALARMKDPRLVQLAIEAWPEMGELKGDLLIAMGMVGKERGADKETIFSASDLSLAGDFLVARLESGKLDKVLTRIAIWGLNKFESPEGLAYLENLLSPKTDIQTLCVALEALGNIGAADSSPKMVAFIEKADKEAQCTELVATDFTGGQVLLSRNSSLLARIIYEIAHIGDHRAVGPMSKLGDDAAYPESIRNLAKEFVFRMRYAPPQGN